MKILTSNLMPPALDWAVCVCEKTQMGAYTRYATEWAHGGPIIEREKMDLSAYLDYWEARLWANREVLNGMPPAVAAATLRARRVTNSVLACGPTPLIAAMRCYVASKLGDEVDVPDELVGATA